MLTALATLFALLCGSLLLTVHFGMLPTAGYAVAGIAAAATLVTSAGVSASPRLLIVPRR